MIRGTTAWSTCNAVVDSGADSPQFGEIDVCVVDIVGFVLYARSDCVSVDEVGREDDASFAIFCIVARADIFDIYTKVARRKGCVCGVFWFDNEAHNSHAHGSLGVRIRIAVLRIHDWLLETPRKYVTIILHTRFVEAQKERFSVRLAATHDSHEMGTKFVHVLVQSVEFAAMNAIAFGGRLRQVGSSFGGRVRDIAQFGSRAGGAAMRGLQVAQPALKQGSEMLGRAARGAEGLAQGVQPIAPGVANTLSRAGAALGGAGRRLDAASTAVGAVRGFGSSLAQRDFQGARAFASQARDAANEFGARPAKRAAIER
jgi:hypothetical protein